MHTCTHTHTHVHCRHLASLRLELARQLQVLEIALADRRGPPGTAAGEVAFPKVGREIALPQRACGVVTYATKSGACVTKEAKVRISAHCISVQMLHQAFPNFVACPWVASGHKVGEARYPLGPHAN